jgi:hypothetical protein
MTFNVGAEQVGSANNLVICILEVIDSNLGRNSYYPVRRFRSLPSPSRKIQGLCLEVDYGRVLPYCFHLIVHYHPVIIPFT